YVFALHLALICAGALLWLSEAEGSDLISVEGRSWSPVHAFIEYEVIADNSASYDTRSIYTGPPSRESEDAWWELLEPALFNASAEEVERAGESLENAAEVMMGGYLAGLGVYHQLHCLQKIRNYIHEDYYYPNMTSKQREDQRLHLDHCLENIRTAVTCHANTDFQLFFWGREDIENGQPEVRSSAKHVCVKWDSLQNWSKSRF
ncbi:hypothetical protein GQ53DRAFT_626293, partial [Thozetella sp. PMI_491]